MMKISKGEFFFFILISFSFIIVGYSIYVTSLTFAQNSITDNSLFSSLSRDLNSTIDGIQNNELTNNNNSTQ